MLSSQKIYVTDTTFWVDYFVSKVPNVRTWGNTMMRSGSQIIITPVILTEFIGRLYFIHHKTPKQIREAIHHLTNIFQNVSFPNFSEQDVKEIVKDMEKLPITPRCHVGELSFLNLIKNPNVITVSSDGGVLQSYVNTERLDPRTDPPTILQIGQVPT